MKSDFLPNRAQIHRILYHLVVTLNAPVFLVDWLRKKLSPLQSQAFANHPISDLLPTLLLLTLYFRYLLEQTQIKIKSRELFDHLTDREYLGLTFFIQIAQIIVFPFYCQNSFVFLTLPDSFLPQKEPLYFFETSLEGIVVGVVSVIVL